MIYIHVMYSFHCNVTRLTTPSQTGKLNDNIYIYIYGYVYRNVHLRRRINECCVVRSTLSFEGRKRERERERMGGEEDWHG